MILGRPIAVSALAFLVFAGVLICQPSREPHEDWLLRLLAGQDTAAQVEVARVRAAQWDFNRKWNAVFAEDGAAKALWLELESNAANVKSFERLDKAIAVLQADPGWLRKDRRK